MTKVSFSNSKTNNYESNQKKMTTEKAYTHNTKFDISRYGQTSKGNTVTGFTHTMNQLDSATKSIENDSKPTDPNSDKKLPPDLAGTPSKSDSNNMQEEGGESKPSEKTSPGLKLALSLKSFAPDLANSIIKSIISNSNGTVPGITQDNYDEAFGIPPKNSDTYDISRYGQTSKGNTVLS